MNRQNWMRNKLYRWDTRFLGVCQELAKWSTCLSRQIGVVIVRENTIIATGFNGPPRGITHCGEQRILEDSILQGIKPSQRHECPRRALGHPSGQGLELCTAAHAEANAIVNAAREGTRTNGASIYMNCGIPCKECLKLIINAGIQEIICLNTGDWYDSLSKFLVRQAGIRIRTFYNLEE